MGTLKDDPIEGVLERPEGVYHLVQDRPVTEQILEEDLPPDEYYDELGHWLSATFPKADPDLLEHIVPVVAAFDTATAFALSFGIAKFQGQIGRGDRWPTRQEPEPGDRESY